MLSVRPSPTITRFLFASERAGWGRKSCEAIFVARRKLMKGGGVFKKRESTKGRTVLTPAPLHVLGCQRATRAAPFLRPQQSSPPFPGGGWGKVPPALPHLIRSLQWGHPLHTAKSVRSVRPPGEASNQPGSSRPQEPLRCRGRGSVKPASQAARLHDNPSPFCFPAEETLMHCGKHKGQLSRGGGHFPSSTADRLR